MAAEMTSRERVQRMFEHREADRIPIWENPWATTLDRWKKQGLRSDDWAGEFGLDKVLHIGTNNSPRYPVKIIEEGEDYIIKTTDWGVTLKEFKEKGSTPPVPGLYRHGPGKVARCQAADGLRPLPHRLGLPECPHLGGSGPILDQCGPLVRL